MFLFHTFSARSGCRSATILPTSRYHTTLRVSTFFSYLLNVEKARSCMWRACPYEFIEKKGVLGCVQVKSGGAAYQHRGAPAAGTNSDQTTTSCTLVP